MEFRGDQLKFSTKEKRAAVLFFIMILLLVVIPGVYRRFQPILITEYTIHEDSVRAQLVRNYKVYEQRKFTFKNTGNHSFEKKKQPKQVTAPFNPDTVTASGWMELGLSERQAEVLIAYKDRIGGFYEIEQLYKAYVLDSNRVNEWKPFLVFEKKKIQRIELNSASAEQLMKLKGIGQGYAKRIITYREKLGGFHAFSQVGEIYNFPPELVQAIEPFCKVDTLLVNKIRINFVTLEELVKHPYFDYKTSRALLNYREQHGAFRSFSDVLKCKAVEEEMSSKWKPYLNFEE